MPEPLTDLVRLEIAKILDAVADEEGWNQGLWTRFNGLLSKMKMDGLVCHAYEELIHYSGELNSRNLLFIRLKPDKHQVQAYKGEFRNIATALRSGISWEEYKRQGHIYEGGDLTRALKRWIHRRFKI